MCMGFCLRCLVLWFGALCRVVARTRLLRRLSFGWTRLGAWAGLSLMMMKMCVGAMRRRRVLLLLRLVMLLGRLCGRVMMMRVSGVGCVRF